MTYTIKYEFAPNRFAKNAKNKFRGDVFWAKTPRISSWHVSNLFYQN
jgi:hypothetical protein